MANKVFVTRKIPDSGIALLKAAGFELVVSEKDGVLTKDELMGALKKEKYDGVLCLLTDHIDDEVFNAAGKQCKIFANYAVGFDNIDLKAARTRNIMVTNTPGVLTETVAEHTFALMLAIAHRVAEADRFTRAGKYKGWGPMLLLGSDVFGKTLGIIGLGRIGARVAHHAVRGFDMKVLYYDVQRNENFEREYGAAYRDRIETLLPDADFVSIHVPLLESTKHLMNDLRFGMMRNTAYLINTSRGPIVDEQALLRALRAGTIKGAALDVFENEPAIEPLLLELDSILLTPHIASGTIETREKMARLAANNLIEALAGRVPPNIVQAGSS
ncbi:MAG: D-glycerate dehydrogenase [Candidatus Ryanbacteria bacterium RIFCSPHIGHO2_12_FULL_47_12b]|uniref:D-glycerate dehydrogenase n=2 Tax=Candidatus Ryaniibacteriota TaxID=1817914 RepID=A0A1G2H575_9BACT|nr:MAG: D-glycerate dehydrogenase [Candidatus Ryanbacteria bacterium RIFCSPHIGHO2_01_FULL_48_80]OGZ48608.1 MAG: D-glycerate dehydrogenase [Candidatus Ryanbacteria bacterium RIFCSPHIGHO2_02_FULL_47_25]OGZ52530.1 MAG: D-glycerate dehydrogenase [Candidatus Ryanbacteria bacterium RIFCSPHIGHO2_12_FULL_47_12b]OGZ56551.1 MAG: D-glycerate dehydrogenase [Candidatus Ryanbacteria bacterium RIFCSPLOWO2_02_FULL_47_14]OGZ57644.1 MAG: D-glycerate dehydrogenase [Candidatus Ryanbacteria bacterium RIFCSPLOWO2_12